MGQVITIIFGVAGFMGIFMFLVNKRIDEISRRIDRVEEDLRDLRKEMDRGLRDIKSEMERRFDKVENLITRAEPARKT